MVRRQGSSKTKAELDHISVATDTLSEHDILLDLAFLEDSINAALNINREATIPARPATNARLSNTDNNSNQRETQTNCGALF